MPNGIQNSTVAVVGGGPIGASVARALAERGCRTVHWFEANHPLEGDFSHRSMSCPWAAGQVLAHSFEPGSLADKLGRRTLQALQQMGQTGKIPIQPRPWLVCAPKDGGPAGEATRCTLETAWDAGQMAGFSRLHGAALERFAGLRTSGIDFALCDETTLAVDPRLLAVGLAKLATKEVNVLPHFGAVVSSIRGNEVIAKTGRESFRVVVDAVVLCVGVHVGDLSVDGGSLESLVPPANITYLHLFDHRSWGHRPVVNYCLAGPATIARYEVFGVLRKEITPHLPAITRAFDINPLLTDVPGLCRLLDTHFGSREEAESHTPEACAEIAALLGEFIDPRLLPGNPQGPEITGSNIASYVKHHQPDGEPTIRWLNSAMPMLYVQPSNGRGVTQSIGLGEYVGDMISAFLG